MNPGPAQPKLRPPGSAENRNQDQTKGAHNRPLIIWGTIALLLILALVVLFFLPAKINQEEQAPVTARVTKQVAAKPAPDTQGITQHDAGLALQDFLRLRAQPNLQGADVWAPKIWSTAMASAELGDDHYGHRRFQDALSSYRSATEQLMQLQVSRPQLLLDTLASAQAALKENKITPAIATFERVLAMQSNHPQAQTGLAQARVREQILALMEEGERAQIVQELLAAASAYETILQLDARYLPAQTALAEVSENLARMDYQRAMSQALSALNSGDLNAADAALQAAAKIEPNTLELLDARQRLQDARKQSALKSLQKQARAYAGKENWSKAIERHKKALAIDSQTTFARSGLEFAQLRQTLNSQLDHYLKAPDRLASDEVLNNARTLLNNNQGTPKNEPLLASKLSALRKAIELASTPVTLVIESDNLTQVTIYHVGRLGGFEQKQIQLRPGQYTVTGTREGYRDVRKVISMIPGTPARLSIRCEETF